MLEIMNYCEKESNYSYYDMKTYAINNKPDWYEFLRSRKNARLVGIVLQDMKCIKKVKYKELFAVSYMNYLDAEIERDKHEQIG